MNGLPGKLRTIAIRPELSREDARVLTDAAALLVHQAIRMEEVRADLRRISRIVAFAKSGADRPTELNVAEPNVTQLWGPDSPGYDEMGQ